MVANYPEKKAGTHWWSFLDTDTKDKLFFSDSSGSLGLLNFIVENDLDILNKIISGKINQIFKQDQKIKLPRWTFKHKNYKKLTSVEIKKLSDTVRNFFAFLDQFGEYKRISNNVKVVTVDDNLQSFQTDYCRIFQMSFYLYLFYSLETSIIARSNSKKRTVELIGKMLNEIFSLNTRHNEIMLDAFILQNDIDFSTSEDESSDNEME